MRSTKRKTLSEFIEDARRIHGNKYDYSLIKEYVNNKTKVPIKCNNCGNVFYQKPNAHLNGNNCPYCWSEKKPQMGKRKIIFGVAHFDINEAYNIDKQTKIAHDVWYNMLQRCYYTKYQESHPTYKGCSVCDKWLYFSNFKKWFDNNYIEGYVLDKDILVNGNKIYSPDTCCFVPQEINALIITRTSHRNKNIKGVSITKYGKYAAFIHKNKKTVNLGHYDTLEEAFSVFQSAKAEYVKALSKKYYTQGKITKRVYESLINYKPNSID